MSGYARVVKPRQITWFKIIKDFDELPSRKIGQELFWNKTKPKRNLMSQSFRLESSENMLQEQVIVPRALKPKKSNIILQPNNPMIQRTTLKQGSRISEAKSQGETKKDVVSVSLLKMRRQSEYEYLSQKQRRLNHFVPQTYIQQLIMSTVQRQKKLNKLRMHYKFMGRKSQFVQPLVKKARGKSKSLFLQQCPKLRHNRSKSLYSQAIVQMMVPLDIRLIERIQKICSMKARTMRRLTTLQVKKKSILLTKERLLRYQEMLKEESISVSNDSSPCQGICIQFQKSTFEKKQKQSNFATPNGNTPHQKNRIKNLSKNLTSSFHFAIHQYINTKSQSTLPKLSTQESLVDFMNKQSLNSARNTIDQKKSILSDRVKTQPSPNFRKTQKQNLIQKLWPYLKS